MRFLERKLTEHGVRKVVPEDDNVLEQHARRVIMRARLNKALETIRPQVEVEAALVELPTDLRQQVVAALERQSAVPWDIAVADIVQALDDGDAPLATRSASSNGLAF